MTSARSWPFFFLPLFLLNKMRCVTYNVNASVSAPLHHNGSRDRLKWLAPSLYTTMEDSTNAPIDVICVQELVVNFKKVQKALYRHPHHTKPIHGCLFGRNIKPWPSGLSIFSRWPILSAHHHVFHGPTHGYEIYMAKAVQNVCIHYKLQRRVHILNTHLCGWSSGKAKRARRRQVGDIRKFIEILRRRDVIRPGELVLLCGDLNVDYYLERATLDKFASRLNARLIEPESTMFSVDPSTNATVGLDDPTEHTKNSGESSSQDQLVHGTCAACPRKLLDVFMIINNETDDLVKKATIDPLVQLKSLSPFRTWLSSRVRRSISDISDHYPVSATINLNRCPAKAPPKPSATQQSVKSREIACLASAFDGPTALLQAVVQEEEEVLWIAVFMMILVFIVTISVVALGVATSSWRRRRRR